MPLTMKINTPALTTLLIISSSFSVNPFYGQNTQKKGDIIVEKIVKTKKDSAGVITETKIIKRFSLDSLSMEINEEFINDSFDLNIKEDSVNSIISIWPNRSLIIIDNDTLLDARKKKHKKSPTVISEGGFMLGFATVKNHNIASITSDFPELKTSNSMHVGFNNQWGIKTFSGNWRIWSGIQYDIFNYRFSNSNMRLQAEQTAFTTVLDSNNNSAKSKLVVNYIGIPLSFGYQSKAKDADEGFSVRAGIVAGYRVRTHTKIKLDNNKTTKDFDDFNMNDFLISPFVQASFNNMGIYFRYNTSLVFKDNQGPRYSGLQFGLVFQ